MHACAIVAQRCFKKFKNSSSKGILAVSDSCNLVYPLEEERFKYPIVLPRDNDNLLQTSWEGWHHASDFDFREGYSYLVAVSFVDLAARASTRGIVYIPFELKSIE